MKKLFLFCLGAVLLLAGCRKDSSVPVKEMTFDPAGAKMFVGEEQAVSIKCYPSDATNLDELTVNILDPSVASFENGKLVGLKGGLTRLDARCGFVLASMPIQVYYGWFTKGGKRYAVESASGYYYMYGGSSPQEVDLTFTCNDSNGKDQQHFRACVAYENLGKTIDFMMDMKGSMVSVWMNNNEDGYSVPYYSYDLGRPVVVTADWSPTDATLTKGVLTVSQSDKDTFKVVADFALSNGYTFTAEWEGPAAMKNE